MMIGHNNKYPTEQFDKALWLSASPNPLLVEHLVSEQKLHVQAGGHWHPDKFGVSTLDPAFAPEKEIQFRLPYLVVPQSQFNIININEIPKQFIEGDKIKLFFHPSLLERYQQFATERGFELRAGEQSEFIAAPTSSYRSLAVIKVDNDKNPDPSFTPIIVKMGVMGKSVGHRRDLPPNEVMCSVYMDEAIRHMQKDRTISTDKHGLEFFQEPAGLFAKTDQRMKIAQDDESITVSNLYRKFPKSLVQKPKQGENRLHYYSMSAIISTLGNDRPKIYDLAIQYLKSHPGKTLKDFFKEEIIPKFINPALKAFLQGVSLEPHAQNIGMVFNDKNEVVRYFTRDGGGYSLYDLEKPGHVNPSKLLEDVDPAAKELFYKKFAGYGEGADVNYVRQYSWFFGYQIIQKMMNLFAQSSTYDQLDLAATGNKYNIMSQQYTPQQEPAMKDRVPSSNSIKRDPATNRVMRDETDRLQLMDITHTSVETSLRDQEILRMHQQDDPLIDNELRLMLPQLKLNDNDMNEIREYISHLVEVALKNAFPFGTPMPEQVLALLRKFPAAEFSFSATNPITLESAPFLAWVRENVNARKAPHEFPLQQIHEHETPKVDEKVSEPNKIVKPK